MQSHDGPRDRAIASLCQVFHGLSSWCRSLFLVCGCAPRLEGDVRAYDACLTCHPQDAPLCEAPRWVYEVDLRLSQLERLRGWEFASEAGPSASPRAQADRAAIDPRPRRPGHRIRRLNGD
jgi:hypothetical protein